MLAHTSGREVALSNVTTISPTSVLNTAPIGMGGSMSATHDDGTVFRVRMHATPDKEPRAGEPRSAQERAIAQTHIQASKDAYYAAWRFNREAGRLEPKNSFSIELPPYSQDTLPMIVPGPHVVATGVPGVPKTPDNLVVNLPVGVHYPEEGVSHFRMVRDNVAFSWLHCRLCTLGLFGWVWKRLTGGGARRGAIR